MAWRGCRPSPAVVLGTEMPNNGVGVMVLRLGAHGSEAGFSTWWLDAAASSRYSLCSKNIPIFSFQFHAYSMYIIQYIIIISIHLITSYEYNADTIYVVSKIRKCKVGSCIMLNVHAITAAKLSR